MESPSLTVVIPSRDGDEGEILDVLIPQLVEVNGEALVVGAPLRAGLTPSPEHERHVRYVVVTDLRMPSLRAVGMRLARGRIIAIGEDHAVPAPGWARAVLDAHDRNPDSDAVVGCLINATDRTVTGRANFLAFAAAWVPPMRALPAHRPPPASTLSFKRRVLDGLGEGPGDVDSILIPRLFAEGRMAVADDVVVFHHQDHGFVWSVANAYASARTGHGYASPADPLDRRAAARSVLTSVPRQLWAEARATRASHRASFGDLLAVGVLAAAAGVGAAAGMLRGPGRAPERVA